MILLINDVVFLVQPLADVVKHVEKGYRMEKPEGCPQEIYKLMCQAWDLNADRRPTFHQVKQQLAQLKEMENWLNEQLALFFPPI